MDSGRLTPLIKSLKRRALDSFQLRLILGAAMLSAWYLAVYTPLSEGIEEARRLKTRALSHQLVARDIEALRIEDAKYKSRLPTGSDPNEWVEHLLVGVRSTPIRLLKLEPQALRKHGPYTLVVVRIEAQGGFADLSTLLAWIESNPRLLRVDSLVLQPTKGVGRDLVLSLTVLGVMA